MHRPGPSFFLFLFIPFARRALRRPQSLLPEIKSPTHQASQGMAAPSFSLMVGMDMGEVVSEAREGWDVGVVGGQERIPGCYARPSLPYPFSPAEPRATRVLLLSLSLSAPEHPRSLDHRVAQGGVGVVQ